MNMPGILITWLLVALSVAPDVGTVSRSLEGSLITGDAIIPAAPESQFTMDDILSTDETGAIAAVLTDGTSLTVGANAEFSIDRYVFNPDESSGEATIRLGKGAMRLISGRISKQQRQDLRIETPVASMGIRGTDIWLGEVDGAFSVLLLSGFVEVTTDAGMSVLDEPGEGLTVTSRSIPPSEPTIWDAGKRARALSQTTF